jgi:hypothetical protein
MLFLVTVFHTLQASGWYYCCVLWQSGITHLILAYPEMVPQNRRKLFLSLLFQYVIHTLLYHAAVYIVLKLDQSRCLVRVRCGSGCCILC